MNTPSEKNHGNGHGNRDAIRADVARTCAHLANRLEVLQTQVMKPVEGAHEVLQTTVDAAQDTLESVQRACGVFRQQMEDRPWLLSGAAAVAGGLTGYCLTGRSQLAPAPAQAVADSPPAPSAISRATSKLGSVVAGVGIALLRDFLSDRFPRFQDPIQQALADVGSSVGAVPFKERFLPPM